MDGEVKIDPVSQRTEEIEKAIKQAKSPAHIRKLIKGEVKNAARLEKLLDIAWEQLPEAEILREYDNGGGQKGTQKSPALKAYQELLRDYNESMSKIVDNLPKNSKEPVIRRTRKKKPQNMLEQIKEKKKGEL